MLTHRLDYLCLDNLIDISKKEEGRVHSDKAQHINTQRGRLCLSLRSFPNQLDSYKLLDPKVPFHSQ